VIVRARIGQLLLEAGRLSSADLERGVAEQRASGLRFASALVKAGLITSDEAARALARQHGIPAALDRHLAGRDPTLTSRLPADVARTHVAVPVALSRGAEGLNLVVCMREPSPEIIALLRAAAGMPIVPSVACELSLREQLELAYPRIDDDSVDIDVDEPSNPFSSIGQVDEMSLVELDDQYVVKDHSQNTTTTGSMPVMGALKEKRQTAPGGMPALDDLSVPAPGPSRVLRPAEAIAALATANEAALVSQIAIDCLRGLWKGGLIMQVKDRERVALGEHGFGGVVREATVESIVVPLDQPSVLRTAYDDRRPFAGEAPIGSTVQDRFLRLFAELGTRTVAVAPVLVRARPIALLFGIAPIGNLPEASAALATLANAMGTAYLRVILASK